MNFQQAIRIAESAREKFAGFCERIEIAGSVRRCKAEGIKDIELVMVPTLSHDPRPGEIFATEPWAPLLIQLDHLTTNNPDEFSRGPWGEKYRKLIWHRHGGVAFDLFFVEAASWGMQFAIRTGPAKFSKLLVTSRRQGGALPDQYKVAEGSVWRQSQYDIGVERVCVPEEQEFFGLLDLPCWKPQVRSELILRQYLERGGVKRER